MGTVPGVSEAKVDKVIEVILFNHEGTFWVGDEGEVLHNLADETGINYKTVSRIVHHLEALGWLYVERVRPTQGPIQANRIVRIAIV